MKTIRFKCYAACCMAFLGMGCTASFEEYNTNPNQMEMWEIGPESLLENLVFKEFECLLHRTWYINGELIQYTVSGSSLNAFHRYVISNGVPSDHWATQFQWAATADHMYRLALEQNDVNCQAIALTMRAFCMAHCTDGFGDVPFTEAFQGRDGLASRCSIRSGRFTNGSTRIWSWPTASTMFRNRSNRLRATCFTAATWPDGSGSPIRCTCGC